MFINLCLYRKLLFSFSQLLKFYMANSLKLSHKKYFLFSTDQYIYKYFCAFYCMVKQNMYCVVCESMKKIHIKL